MKPKKSNQRTMTFMAAGITFFTLFVGITPTLASDPMPEIVMDAAYPGEFKGIAMGSWWFDDLCSESCAKTIKQLAKTGANKFQIVPSWYQDTATSNDIRPHPEKTATDECLIKAIKLAQSYGLAVLLKPHVESRDNVWRGFFKPTDPKKWFASYTKMMTHYATLARDNDVRMVCVGAELVSLSHTHRALWDDLLKAVHQIYKGKLTYAANEEELNKVCFWDSPLINYIGIDAYYQLTNKKNPTAAELKVGWQKALKAILTNAPTKKPILILELGYRSLDGANMYPEDYEVEGNVDLTEQAKCYQAAFEVLAASTRRIKGMYWWMWNPQANAGGKDDTDYTPQGKPAQKILHDWFAVRGRIDFKQELDDASGTLKFKIRPGAHFRNGHRCLALAVVYIAHSQSMSNYHWNSVTTHILRGTTEILQNRDAYPSQSSWGSPIPGYWRGHVFHAPDLDFQEELTLVVNVNSGNYINYISEIDVITIWQ